MLYLSNDRTLFQWWQFQREVFPLLRRRLCAKLTLSIDEENIKNTPKNLLRRMTLLAVRT